MLCNTFALLDSSQLTLQSYFKFVAGLKCGLMQVALDGCPGVQNVPFRRSRGLAIAKCRIR